MSNAVVTVNPFNEEVIDRHSIMTNFELAQAIERCHSAFTKWRNVSHSDRAKIISAIGDELVKNKAKLAKLMTNEMGKLESQSVQEIELCAQICEWTASNGPDELAPIEKKLGKGKKGIIAFSPIGIVYGIQPWNYPAYQVIRYSIANLMAGNGVLLKHAANVTGTGKLLAKVYQQAGLPKYLFTPLIIDHEQSNTVIKNKHVRGVTLTGSAEAGRKIAELCGVELKKSVLELGSNDAYVILDDADIKKAVEISVKGRIYNNGETCIAAKRFVVVEKVYEKFRKAFVKAMKEISCGNPSKNDSGMGPMARDDLREKLHSQVEESISKGAKLLCGGEVPDGEGFFYPATVLENVLPGQPAYEDELFGPVAALIKAKDTDDAMRIANDSRFGLGGGIVSQDVDKAISLAQDVFDTGMIFINDFGLASPAMPFGGVKNSGFGREHGGFGLKEFVNVKAITISKN